MHTLSGLDLLQPLNKPFLTATSLFFSVILMKNFSYCKAIFLIKLNWLVSQYSEVTESLCLHRAQ